jgi:hypothetical protein
MARRSECMHSAKKYIPFILVLTVSGTAYADTWPLPKITDYYSSDSTHFVRIFPQHIPSNYFKWREASPKRKKRFTPADTLITPCYAQMYKRTGAGDSLVWEQNLINRIAPVNALVSDNGKYLVTFDNWHSMGYGVDVMVYYNGKGELIKRHMLEDISPFAINTYKITISSIWWRCGQEFIDHKKVRICFRDKNDKVEERVYDLEEQNIGDNTRN